jgi:hypothetical protein
MRIGNQLIHLTYSMNVHPGKSWTDQCTIIRSVTEQVKNKLDQNGLFGLGPHLSFSSATELASCKDHLAFFKESIEQNNMYVFTLNGFPYESFQNEIIKDRVYIPDWSTPERKNYTMLLAHILANLLPDDETEGSISTLPISYIPLTPLNTPHDACINLIDTVIHLATIRERTGRIIHLGLEPEPDCYLQNTNDCIAFFKDCILTTGLAYLVNKMQINQCAAEEIIHTHLGICFDCCHFALAFENLIESINSIHAAGIRISKLQISSVPVSFNTPEAFHLLRDESYLHQTSFYTSATGEITRYADLPDALANAISAPGEYRTHFHLPLYFSGDDTISTTASQLTPYFFQTVINTGCRHFEIETYTFNVLPESLQSCSLAESITKEYQWLLERIPQ